MQYKGEQFQYNQQGLPLLYRNKALFWERGRLLTKFGNIATFTYNANGIRNSKTSGSTTTQYFLEGIKIIAQKDIVSASNEVSTETLMKFMYGVDGILGIMINNNRYYFQKNLQGDIIAILDNNLETIAKYTYDAWGNHKLSYLNGTEFVDFDPTKPYNIDNDNLYIALKNPFRYRGYYYDFETGLYYLNSRYYDPETGRFINIDDISVLSETQDVLNGINLFAYCQNNPVMFTDETGYFLWFFIGAILFGALLGGVANTLKAYSQGVRGNNLWGAFFGGVVMGAAMGAVAAIGGAAGLTSLGISVAGFGMSSAAAFVTSIGIGILGGGVSYTIESNIRNDMTFSINGLIDAGISGAAQAASTFFVAFAGGRVGAYDKLFINKELGLNIFNKNQLGYSLVKEFMARAFPSLGRTLLTKLYYLMGETAAKLITVGGASAASRWLIDKLFSLYN